ncbi:hypothetical protein GLGCALEP_03377 [Pseudomonas sp. MM221]|nr:hypothetical protein DBADOPDK_03305 [Pseudomonas sp. MM223]CAI3803993.1 hypothetical protein GLGCALEP_03377 [Pseudomonas sp. MM221]
MNRIYPCTAADPMGSGEQDGLLGQGDLPWPSVVAARTYDRLDIGGLYSADDMSAAEFLIAELKSSETELSADEAEEYAVLLRNLISKIETSAEVTKDQALAIKKKAEALPVVGPLLFSTPNLPGTLASIGGVVHAGSKATRVEDLLDLTEATKKQLKRWATSRGKPGSVSPRRAFRGRIKLVSRGGNLFFEIPATTKANIYRVAGKTVGDVIHLPAYGTAKELSRLAHVDSSGYGQRGVGKVLGKAGPALAFGPQLAIDAHDATSFEDFLSKSAYSQPTNAAAFAAGVVVGSIMSGPAIVVISVGWIAGVVVQLVMSDEVTGAGTAIGDFLTGKD